MSSSSEQPTSPADANAANPPSEDLKELYVSVWRTTVDTQMHFNEMSVKARQFGLTFVAAALGLGVVMFSRGQEFAILIPLFGGFNLNATVLIILGSAFALSAVRQLDLNVYHRMLRGAVTFGEDFEQTYMRQIFDLEKGMTGAISHFSRYQDAAITQRDGKYVYSGSIRRTAEQKIKRFYNYAITILVITSLLLFSITAHFGHGLPPSPSDLKADAAPQTGGSSGGK
jgi:hypothetical protein